MNKPNSLLDVVITSVLPPIKSLKDFPNVLLSGCSLEGDDVTIYVRLIANERTPTSSLHQKRQYVEEMIDDYFFYNNITPHCSFEDDSYTVNAISLATSQYAELDWLKTRNQNSVEAFLTGCSKSFDIVCHNSLMLMVSTELDQSSYLKKGSMVLNGLDVVWGIIHPTIAKINEDSFMMSNDDLFNEVIELIRGAVPNRYIEAVSVPL